MKKTVILLLLVCLALPAFADTAMMLPAGIFRLTLVPNYGFTPGVYDNTGTYSSLSSGQSEVTAWNLGVALEYGVTDWIAIAVQWTPGWNFSSNVDELIPPSTSSLNVNGLYDAFVGAEVQIVGEKAPVASKTIRFNVAAGVTVPFGGANFQDQATNAANGSAVTVANPDIQTLGLGARIYADYIFSDAFYLNLYSQFIYYPGTVAFKDWNFQTYGKYAATTYNPDVGFGYKWTVELEPHYIFTLSKDVTTLEVSLPFDLTYMPDYTLSGTDQAGSSQSLIFIRPTIDLFLMKSPIPFPLELKLEYQLPLIGWNDYAQNAVIFVIRVYF